MARKQRYGRRQSGSNLIWLFLIPIILIGAWLGVSIYKGINPIEIFSSSESIQEKEQIPYDSLQTLYTDQVLKTEALSKELDLFKSSPNLKIVSIANGTLNLREVPSTSGLVLAGIASGSSVNLYYCNSDSTLVDGTMGSWCKINHQGSEGWVWSSYLSDPSK